MQASHKSTWKSFSLFCMFHIIYYFAFCIGTNSTYLSFNVWININSFVLASRPNCVYKCEVRWRFFTSIHRVYDVDFSIIVFVYAQVGVFALRYAELKQCELPIPLILLNRKYKQLHASYLRTVDFNAEGYIWKNKNLYWQYFGLELQYITSMIQIRGNFSGLWKWEKHYWKSVIVVVVVVG